MTSFHLNWRWVRCEATQFAMAATNQTGQHDLLRLDWSQPRWTGSLHSALTATQFRWIEVSLRWGEMRWDEMSDTNAPLNVSLQYGHLISSCTCLTQQWPRFFAPPCVHRFVLCVHCLLVVCKFQFITFVNLSPDVILSLRSFLKN